MTDHLRIALAQLNPVVGDIEGNMAMLINSRKEAAQKSVELLVASELSITGYPPEDLVLRREFISKVEEAVLHLAAKTGDSGPGLLIGAPWRDEGKLYNAALLLDEGKVTARRYKHELPNYGVLMNKEFLKPAHWQARCLFVASGWGSCFARICGLRMSQKHLQNQVRKY